MIHHILSENQIVTLYKIAGFKQGSAKGRAARLRARAESQLCRLKIS